MFTIAKASTFSLILFVLSSFCFGETVYLTFPKNNSDGTLSKQDTSLRINEKDVTVSEFFQVNTGQRSIDLLSHPVGRRQYFIVLDLLYLHASQALEIRKMIQDFVSRVPREDLIALGAITNEDGLRFFSGLTADRSKLIAGFNAMGKVNLSGMVEGPEGNLYPSNFSADVSSLQLLPDAEFISNLKTYAINEKAKEQFAPLYVQAFVDLVSLFSTVQGRKHLILFSPGTDVSGLRVNLEELSGSESDEKKPEPSEPPAEEHKTMREITQQGPRDRASMDATLRSTTIRENDANVVWKLMQGTGGQAHIFRPAEQENKYLKDLAEKSKGSYRKMQEFPAAAQEILRSDEVFYVLGWQTEPQKEFHELQQIQIKVKNESLESPTRWLAPKALSDYTALEKRMRLSQAVYKNFGTGDAYRFWSDIILDEGFNRISTFTQVPGKYLLDLKSPKLEFVFYGFAVEEDGTVLDYSSTPISLDLTNQKLIERLQKTGLKIWNVLLAAQKPVTVRTVVWNSLTSQAVTHSSIVDFDVSQLLLTNPFFPSSNFDWVLWPAPDQSLNRRGKEIIYPYQIGADLFTPELTPRLQPEEKGKVVYFKVYNFTPGEKYPAVKLSLVGENGNSTEIHRFGLLQQPRLIQRGGLEVFWTIEAIPGLHKGNYRFQVHVTDTAQGKSVIRDVLTWLE